MRFHLFVTIGPTTAELIKSYLASLGSIRDKTHKIRFAKMTLLATILSLAPTPCFLISFIGSFRYLIILINL